MFKNKSRSLNVNPILSVKAMFKVYFPTNNRSQSFEMNSIRLLQNNHYIMNI